MKKDIKKAAMLFEVAAVMNSVSRQIIGDKFTLVSPFVEEASKAASIKGGYGSTFITYFNVAEFSQYMLSVKNVDKKKLALLRFCTVLMHISTFIAQKKIKNKFIGYLIGVPIHLSWNIIALKYNSQIMEFISKKKENLS